MTQSIRQFLQKTNGWQRLWIIVTGIWFFGVSFTVARDYPTEGKLHDSLYSRVEQFLPFVAADPKTISEYCDKKFPLGSENTSEFAENFVGRTECYKTNRYKEVNSEHDKQRGKLMQEYEQKDNEILPALQAKAIGYGFLLWITPALLLYGFGLAIVWVRKGFKPIGSL